MVLEFGGGVFIFPFGFFVGFIFVEYNGWFGHFTIIGLGCHAYLFVLSWRGGG